MKTRTPVDLSLKSQDRNSQVRALGMLSRDTVQKVNGCGLGDCAIHESSDGTQGGI